MSESKIYSWKDVQSGVCNRSLEPLMFSPVGCVHTSKQLLKGESRKNATGEERLFRYDREYVVYWFLKKIVEPLGLYVEKEEVLEVIEKAYAAQETEGEGQA